MSKYNSTFNLLNDRNNLKYKLILQSLIVGLLTGIVIVLNRIAISKFSNLFKEIYLWANDNLI